MRVKDKKDELNESTREMSTDDDFIEVRSRKKKHTKQIHSKKRRSRSHSSSTSLTESSAPETEEGNTKEYAQKRVMAKDVKAESIKDILLIGVKTIKKVLSDKCDASPVINM